MSKFKGKIRGPLRRPESVKDTQQEYDASWSLLCDAFHGIHHKNAGNYLFEELYRNAYQIVLKKNGAKLYDGFKGVVRGHLAEVIEGLDLRWRRVDKAAGEVELAEARATYLAEVHAAWQHHLTSMSMMSDVLMYLDKVYARTANELVVYEAGLVLFKNELLHAQEVPTGARVAQVILDLIEAERCGQLVPRASIRHCTDMFAALDDVYVPDFEVGFLAATREFYAAEGARLIDAVSIPEYMLSVERRLREEEERVDSYLVKDTLSKSRPIVEHELIATYMRRILDGLARLADGGHAEDLARMYQLVSRVDPETVVHNEYLTEVIVRAGTQINAGVETTTINPTAAALKWVQDVLDLRDLYERILGESYGGQQIVANTITRAFSAFVDRNPRSAEFISLFIDDHLKKGLKGKTEAEVADVLDKTVALFRFVGDKDVFERYYKSHLAKRLLNGRSVSDDAERGMIQKLKLEVGSTFTSKMEGMFKDMKVSADIMREFRPKQQQQQQADGVELGVSVLTSTFWPIGDAKSATCQLPAALEASRAAFEAYYLKRHSGRQLTWLPTHGTADVRAYFGSRRYDLNMSTYAMVCLIAVSDAASSVSLEDLQSTTRIPETELVRALQSLACGKFRVLSKDPKSRDVRAGDRFAVNASFSAPTVRVKIAAIASKVETETERKETYSRVEETRKHQIEACVVRTMKARRQMDYNNLVADVVRQLTPKFHPDPQQIKARIESLIEREYLERDAEDRRLYRYLA